MADVAQPSLKPALATSHSRFFIASTASCAPTRLRYTWVVATLACPRASRTTYRGARADEVDGERVPEPVREPDLLDGGEGEIPVLGCLLGRRLTATTLAQLHAITTPSVCAFER
jgi:hypothetical protein